MIHLDTSFLIRALAPGSPEDRKLRGWMGEGETLGMSAVAWAELLCGPLERSEMEWVAEIVGQRQDLSARSNASFSAAIPITRTCRPVSGGRCPLWVGLASEWLLLPGGANVRFPRPASCGKRVCVSEARSSLRCARYFFSIESASGMSGVPVLSEEHEKIRHAEQTRRLG